MPAYTPSDPKKVQFVYNAGPKVKRRGYQTKTRTYNPTSTEDISPTAGPSSAVRDEDYVIQDADGGINVVQVESEDTHRKGTSATSVCVPINS